MKTLPKNIDAQLQLTLNNLNLAYHVASYLRDAAARGEQAIPTEVFLGVGRHRVHLPGSNSGFFTTPVIHCAILDVRRTLEFFRIYVDPKSGGFAARSGPKRLDDFVITDLGLMPLDPAMLFSLGVDVLGRSPVHCVEKVCLYSNKELAHFTTRDAKPDFACVIDATKLMRVALLRFVYDAYGASKPILYPTITDT